MTDAATMWVTVIVSLFLALAVRHLSEQEAESVNSYLHVCFYT